MVDRLCLPRSSENNPESNGYGDEEEARLGREVEF